MKAQFKKSLAIILIIISIFGLTPGSMAVHAIPAPPTAPTAPPIPEVTQAPPEQQIAPTPPPEPTTPPVPGSEPTPVPTTIPDSVSLTSTPTDNPNPTPTNSPQTSLSSVDDEGEDSINPLASQTNDTQNNGGNVGDTTIDTGDSTVTGSSVSQANSNIAGVAPQGGEGITVGTEGNGSGSTNSTGVNTTDVAEVVQINQASVVNDFEASSQTGSNQSSNNVGETTIETGDSNVSGFLLTEANSNIAGLSVAEFNIEDNQVGDYILDFSSHCIVGCGSNSTIEADNSDNGSDSTNSNTITDTDTTSTFQQNEADIENTLTLSADSGNNDASRNTGGDTIIDTGDVNISANAMTFANNNIAGNVVLGVVNIYGDLTGDIIFPEEYLNSCCSTNSIASTIDGNGSGSTNANTVDVSTTDETFQTNIATIDNVIIADANTGNNSASGNTGGDTEINTGDSTLDVNILNVANSNMDGGVWWLVLVNEAGNWIGKIMGSPDNSNFAGSEGTEFTVDPAGNITASNTGNGDGSNNSNTINQSSNTTTTQNNVATVTNTLDLTGNTGGNNSNNNTGGDTTINTGDVNMVANIVNFVNNNIIGNGKLFVTVVNVFGNWVGDFVGPGMSNAASTSQAQTDSNTPSNGSQPIGGTDISQPRTSSGESTQNNTNESNDTDLFVDTSSDNDDLVDTIYQTSRQAYANIPDTNRTGNSLGTGDESEFSSSTDKNLAYVMNPLTGGVQKKSITINLAWLLLVVPFGILWIVKRRLTNRIHI